MGSLKFAFTVLISAGKLMFMKEGLVDFSYDPDEAMDWLYEHWFHHRWASRYGARASSKSGLSGRRKMMSASMVKRFGAGDRLPR